MKQPNRSYEDHLTIREISVPPGKEWTPKISGWSLIQVGSGTGYWLEQKTNHELETGMVILLAPGFLGNFRASQLGGLSLAFFPVEPKSLIGLFSFTEQQVFEIAKFKKESALKIFQANSPVAAKMKAMYVDQNRSGASFRLALLQLFLEAFGNDLTPQASGVATVLDAKARLRDFLNRTPESELINLSISELSQMTRCTPRHLSRIFLEVVGVPFRDKHTQVRMARARELLATTESKVVDIALESGYQSLSLFNLMFTRSFGMSPGRWRQSFGRKNSVNTPRSRRNEFLLESR